MYNLLEKKERNLRLIIHPDRLIDAFHALSEQWNDNYADSYARALMNTGIYFQKDAESEAWNVGRCMNRAYLEPFIIGENAFASFDSLAESVEEYGFKNEYPAIFILGSGNTALPLILNIAIGTILGHHVYFRASSGNREALGVWLSSLEDEVFDEYDKLLTAFEYIRESITEIALSHDDPAYRETVSRLPIQKAYLWGGGRAIDNTIEMLSQSVTPYLLGPRTGVLVLEYNWWTKQPDSVRQKIAEAIYDNITVFDSALCSSPTRGILIGTIDEAAAMIDEIAGYIIPSEDEACRFSRSAVQSSNNYRISMTGWKKFGYRIIASSNSLVRFAVGSRESFEIKNRFSPAQYDYHSSNGSMEIVVFLPDEMEKAASMIAHLQDDPHYDGLWSVGHLIKAASESLIEDMLQTIEIVQQKNTNLRDNPRILYAFDLRVVDVGENIGRKPGVAFDGICIAPSMLE